MSDQTPEPQQTLDELVQKLENITNADGKPKYEDPSKAVDALKHSQEHISKLEEENRKMREDMEKISEKVSTMQTTEDIVAKFSQKLESSQSQTEQPSVAGLDEQKIAELARQVMQQENQAEREKRNLTKFAEAVSSNTNEVEAAIEKAANANGLGKEFFMSMAKSSPEAALKLMGVEPSAPNKPKPSVNTSALPDNPVKTDFKMSDLRTNKDRMAAWDAVAKEVEAKLNN